MDGAAAARGGAQQTQINFTVRQQAGAERTVAVSKEALDAKIPGFSDSINPATVAEVSLEAPGMRDALQSLGVIDFTDQNPIVSA